MREKIPTHKRERIEKIAMLLLILFLLIDIGIAIKQRRDMTMELNDCIRFYRYFPDFMNDTEFYFINKCDNYFDEEGIEKLRASGRAWNLKQLEGGISLYG